VASVSCSNYKWNRLLLSSTVLPINLAGSQWPKRDLNSIATPTTEEGMPLPITSTNALQEPGPVQRMDKHLQNIPREQSLEASIVRIRNVKTLGVRKIYQAIIRMTMNKTQRKE
jgi:hypothetical protein